MTISRLWAFLAVGLPVLGSLLGNLSMVDIAYHVRAGGQILDTGAIPRTDTFTFTAAGANWLNQQWGAQLIVAAVFRAASWTGLVILRAALVGLTFGLILETCRRRGLDLRRAAWITLGAFLVAAVALALRPQLFGMTLLALTILLVVDRRAHPRRLWAIPVIVAVWANLHGSFFLGPVVLGLAWLEDVADRGPHRNQILAVALVAAAASLVNPFGIGVWAYALGLSTNAFVTSRITEWQPTSLRTVPGILFFASAAAILVLIARRAGKVSWPILAWLAVFALVGAYAIRGVAWWPLGAAVVAATLLVNGPQDAGAVARPGRSSRLNVLIAGLIAAVCVALLPLWRPIDTQLDAPAGVLGDAPGGVTAALRQLTKPGDRILNPQPWGSWFELALPANPVAIDSRIELFPVDVWTRLDGVHTGTADWQDQLAAWGVRFVAATDDDTAFVARLEAIGWRVAFRDSVGSVLAAP